VLITVIDEDKPAGLEVAKKFRELGFRIKATEGTKKFFDVHGVASEYIRKMHEGRPNITDAIKNNEVQLVINTPGGRLSQHDDSYIRKTAIKYKVPYITTAAAATAAAKGIEAYQKGTGQVKPLQTYHTDIK